MLLVGFLAGCGEFHFSPFPPVSPFAAEEGEEEIYLSSKPAWKRTAWR